MQFLKDDYTYLAVEIIRGETINYALLEIPSDKVPRFVNLPPETPRRRKPMILLDNILRYCWTISSKASSITTRSTPTR